MRDVKKMEIISEVEGPSVALTRPIHYSVYTEFFFCVCVVGLFSALPVETKVVWSQGLKRSVDITFKASSSVPPLSQEMSLSHKLYLSLEKQTGHLGINWFPRPLSLISI